MTEQSVMDVPTWTLGDRLRKAREFARLEQNELATRIGISRGTVSNYELDHWGVRGPKLIVIREWARTCGVPLEWIMEADIDASSGRDTGDYVARSPELAAA